MGRDLRTGRDRKTMQVLYGWVIIVKTRHNPTKDLLKEYITQLSLVLLTGEG